MRAKWYLKVGLAMGWAAAVPLANAELGPPVSVSAPSSPIPVSSSPAAVGAAGQAPVTEVSVTALEPRYVAPTLRDRLGRIWAPVYLNGKGPYRLVLDTGASTSAVNARVAAELNLPAVEAATVLLHGVTGQAIVPVVKVDTFLVGDLESHNKQLPIVPDALGGADGVLGTEGLEDKRIYIDFRHDKIVIAHSHGRRADAGFVTIPLVRTANGLLMTTAYVGGVRVKAIIDTGGQVTVANPALQAALKHRHPGAMPVTSITGATDDVQIGHDMPISWVSIGGVIIEQPFLTVSDLHIWERWKLTDEPAMLIGIDTLGLLDILIIDYRRMELQIKTRE